MWKYTCKCGATIIEDGYGDFVHEGDWLYGCNPSAARSEPYPVASVGGKVAVIKRKPVREPAEQAA
jgi:hypothetical protein